MTASLGRIAAHLSEPNEEFSPDLVTLINAQIKPPEPVTVDDVYIRAMYIVSDSVNSFGGRFTIDEHENLCRLLIDSPVLVGHRKDKLPLGRNFHAELVERDGRRWIKSYFYWLRATDSAESLKENIDGGIYKECSIAFTFHLPECSVCGKDVRRCEHEPFAHYNQGGADEVCHFNYRQIERVLETSLVYRGALPDTKVAKELDEGRGDESLTSSADEPWWVVPRYEGVPVRARVSGGSLALNRLDGRAIEVSLGDESASALLPEECPLNGRLVGFRGKARCSAREVDKHLLGEPSRVSRLILFLYPPSKLNELPKTESKASFQIRPFPHRQTSRATLDQQAREIMTSHGVEIIRCDSDSSTPIPYHPERTINSVNSGASLVISANGTQASLTAVDGQTLRHWSISNFDADRLLLGRRFVAERADKTVDQPTVASGELAAQHSRALLDHKEGISVICSGPLGGRYLLKPIKLGGGDKLLVQRVAGELKR